MVQAKDSTRNLSLLHCAFGIPECNNSHKKFPHVHYQQTNRYQTGVDYQLAAGPRPPHYWGPRLLAADQACTGWLGTSDADAMASI